MARREDDARDRGQAAGASAGDGDERVVPMRLQRFLARAGAASRRGSENLMTQGRVRVNGRVVTELGSKVDPSRDRVTVDGVEVRISDEAAWIVLNKPAGYLTTMSDPYGRRCVRSLVPTGRYPGIFPIGRLDTDTTGVLVFTTDGMAAQRLLHPSAGVTKHYVALVEGRPSEARLERIRRGIMLDDGPASPAEARVVGPDEATFRIVCQEGDQRGCSVVALTLHEGKKHEVKRMLAAIGHKVLRLHRDAFGPVTLRGVGEGSWRTLDADERQAISAIVGDTGRR